MTRNHHFGKDYFGHIVPSILTTFKYFGGSQQNYLVQNFVKLNSN